MKHDFNQIIDRSNTNSIKYDFALERGKPEDVLPLWVADMDFQAPQRVLEDISKAVSHGIFGYSEVKSDYYNSVINWFSSRYGFSFAAEDVVKTPGIVFALAQAVRAFTDIGESVLIQTPVYYPFYDIIRDNERRLITNPLIYKDGAYSIDFADFESKIVDEQVKVFILCNPHNPVGRVWTREELESIKNICEKHSVIVLSDEIHCDFVRSGYKYTSFGLLSEEAIIATAPSKTFNIAGLQVSNIIVKNPVMRDKLKKEIDKTGYSQLNNLGLIACQSAYTHGDLWLEELKEYIEQNIHIVKTFISERLPKIKLVESQATYLVWLDFSAYNLTQDELDRRVSEGAKLWLDSGTMFGEDATGFQRINIACPKTILIEALNKLEKEFKI